VGSTLMYGIGPSVIFSMVSLSTIDVEGKCVKSIFGKRASIADRPGFTRPVICP
jgi:hypothetical protein